MEGDLPSFGIGEDSGEDSGPRTERAGAHPANAAGTELENQADEPPLSAAGAFPDDAVETELDHPADPPGGDGASAKPGKELSPKQKLAAAKLADGFG